MHHPPPVPAAPSPEPLSLQAGRLASVATAAALALSRGSLADPRAAEELALDLLDVVGILARRLASDTEALQAQLEGVPA
ncbi:MAG TPA: hypothetical protein PKY50_19315 [Candidatus Competibacter sp.]|nr:hypothetical protein [Candidatus Competibacter sp.]